MLVNIFPIQILHTSLGINTDDIYTFLSDTFRSLSNSNHMLEKQGGKSTHSINNNLHKLEIFYPLVSAINTEALNHWANLGLSTAHRPVISSMWANLHEKGSYTDLHSHSTHVMAGCFYLKFPSGGGDIVFLNPAEYMLHYYPFNAHNKDDYLWKSIKIKENDLIIFPGHMKHKTEKNYSQVERISINFNLDYEKIYED